MNEIEAVRERERKQRIENSDDFKVSNKKVNYVKILNANFHTEINMPFVKLDLQKKKI